MFSVRFVQALVIGSINKLITESLSIVIIIIIIIIIIKVNLRVSFRVGVRQGRLNVCAQWALTWGPNKHMGGGGGGAQVFSFM